MPGRTDRSGHEPHSSRTARILLSSLLALQCGCLLSCLGDFDVAENGGIGGTGISQGPITGFGSIFVNGVEWETGEADVSLDDAPAVQEALRLGMVVTVEGTLSADGEHGNARSVVFESDVKGPIDATPIETVPGVEKQFSVLGRPVIVDVTFTTFDGTASFDELEADDMVEVSGLIDADGRIHATRLEGNDAFDPGSSTGKRTGVAQLWRPQAASAGSFAIDDVTIRYDSDTKFKGLEPGDLANAPRVEVKGVLESTDEIRADQVKLDRPGFEPGEGQQVEITGFVSDFVSEADFRVLGLPVDASKAEIDNDLVLEEGVLVEIEGELVDGVLVAEEVEESDDDDFQIQGTVSALDPGARTISLGDVEVRSSGHTKLEDQLLQLPNFGFMHITVGDWLEVEAKPVESESGTVEATRIVRRASEGDAAGR